jgi:hypothetical protein
MDSTIHYSFTPEDIRKTQLTEEFFEIAEGERDRVIAEIRHFWSVRTDGNTYYIRHNIPSLADCFADYDNGISEALEGLEACGGIGGSITDEQTIIAGHKDEIEWAYRRNQQQRADFLAAHPEYRVAEQN